jgi:nicotinamide mononucleotide transporter
MSPIEIIAVLFTLACVLGAAKGRVWSWPIGLVGVSAYAIVFAQTRLYADLGLQAIYFIQGVMGWIAWSRARGARVEVPVRRTSSTEWLIVLLGVPLATAAIGFVLKTNTDAALPWADAALTSLSLAANVLLIRRAVGNWPCWVVADAGYVALFLVKGLTLSAGLYAVFFVMASWGWWRWHRELNGDTEPARVSLAPP